MSKSRNSRRREQASYSEEDIEYHSKKELKKNRIRRKEKRLTTALKSKNINLISQLEEEFD